MNTIICFCSCRNDGNHCVTTFSVLPKNLAARICGTSEPKKTGCVSCASEKRNKCWSFPHWWLISRYSHTQHSKAPKTATFPASFPRGWPEGKGYSLAVDDGTLMEWKGEELNLLVPVCQCVSRVVVCVCGGLCLAASVSGECPVFYHLYLSACQCTIQPGTLLGRRLGSGKQNTVWFICVRVVISEVIFCCWGCINSSFPSPDSNSALGICYYRILIWPSVRLCYLMWIGHDMADKTYSHIGCDSGKYDLLLSQPLLYVSQETFKK